MSQQVRKYPCKKCGHPFEAYPPDDIHTQANLKPDPDGKSIEQSYECDNCSEMNKLHWRSPGYIAGGPTR